MTGVWPWSSAVWTKSVFHQQKKDPIKWGGEHGLTGRLASAEGKEEMDPDIVPELNMHPHRKYLHC